MTGRRTKFVPAFLVVLAAGALASRAGKVETTSDLLDTLLVRSVIVPALVWDAGPRVWWPSALGRGSSQSQA